MAELLRRYPTEANAALVTDFGLTERQVVNAASRNGITKANGRVPTEGLSVRKRVLQAAVAAGDLGVSRAEASIALPGIHPDQVSTALNNLSTGGKLFRAGKKPHSRWFATADFAQAYAGQQAAPPPLTAGEAIKTAATVETLCKPVLGPAALIAPTECDSLFSALNPGRYIDAQAKPWVAAITTPSGKA